MSNEDLVARLNLLEASPGRPPQGTVILELCAEIRRLLKEVRMWKAGHDNQVMIKQAVQQRPDLHDRTKRVQSLVACADALAELVATKEMVDREGKTPEYEERRDRAWNQARAALAVVNPPSEKTTEIRLVEVLKEFRAVSKCLIAPERFVEPLKNPREESLATAMSEDIAAIRLARAIRAAITGGKP